MISSIILAAGLSRRMGQPKQLLTYRGQSLIRTVVENVLAGSTGEVIVVTGAYRDPVEEQIKDLPVNIIFNPHFESGQGSSLSLGMQAITPTCKGIMVMMGDQPLIGPSLIKDLTQVYLKTKKLIVRPVFQGQPGHPVFFNPVLLPHLTTLTGDTGAREILKRYRQQLELHPVDNRAVCFDVDTEQDWLILQSMEHQKQ